MNKDQQNSKNNLFDVQNFVQGIKSMFDPNAATPQPKSGDLLGEKLESVSKLLQEVAQDQVKQADKLTQANKLVSELFKDIETIKRLADEQVEVHKQQAEDSQSQEEHPAPNSEDKPNAEAPNYVDEVKDDEEIIQDNPEDKKPDVGEKPEDKGTKK